MRHPPVVLGIVGKPVAERAALAAGIAHLLGGAQHVARLSIDDYRKYDREEGIKQAVTAAHPAAVRLDMVEQQLGLLKRGEAVLRPTYNQQRGAFEAAAYIEPRPFVVIDGELGFATQGLRNNTDLRVFYGSHEPVAEWPETLEDDAEAYVESQRKWADMVVERMPSDSTEGEMVLTLRPTLPPLTLQALIEAAGEQHGMRLELARDMGLPVDRIVIDGAMSGQAAAYFEQWLLAELPVEFRQNATALGVVSGVQQRSESLALAQLVVALYWLKAANG